MESTTTHLPRILRRPRPSSCRVESCRKCQNFQKPGRVFQARAVKCRKQYRTEESFWRVLHSLLEADTSSSISSREIKPDAPWHWIPRLASGLLAFALLLVPTNQVGAVTTSQDGSENLTIKFKASKVPAIREAQEALVQTWGYATTQFLDPNFNGVDWPQQLQVSCMP